LLIYYTSVVRLQHN